MTKKNSPDPNALFLEVERSALPYPVRTVALADTQARKIGLLLYEQGAAPSLPAALQNALSQRPEDGSSHPRPGAAAQEGTEPGAALPDRKTFRNLLARELECLGKSRLPCTLILFGLLPRARPDDVNISPQLAGLVAACLSRAGTVARYAADTLAILLPATNLGTGLQHAAAILKAIKEKLPADDEGSPLTSRVVMGITVGHAFDNLNPETFLQKGEAELQRARKKGPGAICHHLPPATQDLCQVTVEERAELFRPFG